MSKSKGGKREPKVIKAPQTEPLIETIMEECIRVQPLSYQELIAELKPGTIFPPAIPVASGHIFTSSEGFKVAGKLAALYKFEPPALRAQVSRDTYAKAVLYALGDSILGIRDQTMDDVEDWLAPMTALFKEKLTARLSGVKRDRTQIVPCHIFDHDQVAATFEIGPVTFYPRPEWLKTLDAEVTRTDLIDGVWSNSLSIDDLRKMAFGSAANDAIRGAYYAVTTIGPHWWIGVVNVTNYDPIQSSKKGTTLVSLAMDFLCLLFNPADGARLVYAGGERMPLGERNLFADSQGKLLDSMKINKPGIGGRPGWANDILNESLHLRKAAGTILSRYDSESSSGKVSRLIERWVNALHWYGQALREPSDFMAIVKYGCSIDILTGAGGNLGKMASCAAVAFGCNSDTEINGRNLIDDLNLVFNEGRSALAHGTSFGVLAEKREERALANSLVHHILLAFTEPLAEIIGENNRMLTLEDNELRAFKERLKSWAKKESTAQEPAR